MRGLLISLVLVAATDLAYAHGGGGFRGPVGYWKRGIPCSCAKIECADCANEELRVGKEISSCRTKITELNRWGDIAHLQITVRFETKRKRGSVEGYVRLEPAPVFAAVAGHVQSLTTASAVPEHRALTASLRKSDEACRIYLWERKKFNFDPLLVLRRAPGEIHARAFPISRQRPMRVTIVGYAIRARADSFSVRLYRTGRRYLAVGPKDRIRFLSERDCRRQFGTAVAVVVPCVPALETAMTGVGSAAAGGEMALAAFPPGSKLPPFVGPDVFVKISPPAPPLPADPKNTDPAPPPPPQRP